MNNDNQNEKGNGNNSLFSIFEDSLNNAVNGDEDIEEIEESGTPDGSSRRSSDSYNYGNDTDYSNENSSLDNGGSEYGNGEHLNRQNKFNNPSDNQGLTGDNPSNPANFSRNRMPNNPLSRKNNENSNPLEQAEDIVDTAKKAKDIADKAKKAKQAADTVKTVGEGAKIAQATGTATTGAAVGTGTATTGAAVGGAAGGFSIAGVLSGITATGSGIISGLITFFSTPPGWITAGILAAVAVIGIFLIFIGAVTVYHNSMTDIQVENGYAIISSEICPYVTVTNAGDYDGTYPFEDYVAGVIAGEVAFFGSDTVNKTFAIAARSYFYTHHNNCSIAGNATKQAYKPPTAATKSAAIATAGMVIIKSGQILSTEYDAFAYKSEDSSNYYLIQKNQAIPKTWAQKKGININAYKNAYHGRGMSQWGSLYLAETGKNYEQILKYYYGDDIVIAKTAFNPNVKDTATSANGILHQPLSQFLASRGSSVAALTASINASVNAAGYGTANGVAAAAYSLITILDQNYGIRLPYAHGGHAVYNPTPATQPYTAPLGVDGAWGTYGNYTWNGSTLHYYGLDCNGFMQWAMYNGGMPYKHVYTDASSMRKEYGVSSCSAKSSDCKGAPGDLLVNGSHVMMIVGVTDTTYTIAHSSSPTKGMFIFTSKKASLNYQVVQMGSYYSTHRR